MKKTIISMIVVLELLVNVFCVFADDICDCDDLVKRIEQLESIVYQNTNNNSLDTIALDTLPTLAQTPDLGIKSINIGDKVVLDFVEFSFEKIEWTDILEPSETSGFYTYYSDKDGEKYVSIWGNIKNLSGEKIYIDEMKIEFKFNNKYSYSGSIVLENNDKKGFTSLYCSVKPLAQSQFVIYASVPDEILTILEHGVLTFGFNDNFSRLSFRDELSDLPFVYNLDFSK